MYSSLTKEKQTIMKRNKHVNREKSKSTFCGSNMGKTLDMSQVNMPDSQFDTFEKKAESKPPFNFSFFSAMLSHLLCFRATGQGIPQASKAPQQTQQKFQSECEK